MTSFPLWEKKSSTELFPIKCNGSYRYVIPRVSEDLAQRLRNLCKIDLKTISKTNLSILRIHNPLPHILRQVEEILMELCKEEFEKTIRERQLHTAYFYLQMKSKKLEFSEEDKGEILFNSYVSIQKIIKEKNVLYSLFGLCNKILKRRSDDIIRKRKNSTKTLHLPRDKEGNGIQYDCFQATCESEGDILKRLDEMKIITKLTNDLNCTEAHLYNLLYKEEFTHRELLSRGYSDWEIKQFKRKMKNLKMEDLLFLK